MTSPTPVGPAPVFPISEAPEGSYDADRPTIVRYGLSVAPNGSVYDCRVEISSGNPDLDRQTCRIALREARFRPATDSQGQPAYGVFRDDARWWFGEGRSPLVVSLDGEFTVAKLPGNIPSPAILNLAVAIDPQGRPSGCSAGTNETRASLASVACGQLMGDYRAVPVKNSAGSAIASVQNAIVSFRTN